MKQLIFAILMVLGLAACAPMSKEGIKDTFKEENLGTYYLDGYSSSGTIGGVGNTFQPIEGQRIIITDDFYRIETRINGEWILEKEGRGPRDIELDFEAVSIQDIYFYGTNNYITYRYVKAR